MTSGDLYDFEDLLWSFLPQKIFFLNLWSLATLYPWPLLMTLGHPWWSVTTVTQWGPFQSILILPGHQYLMIVDHLWYGLGHSWQSPRMIYSRPGNFWPTLVIILVAPADPAIKSLGCLAILRNPCTARENSQPLMCKISSAWERVAFLHHFWQCH